MKRFKVTDTITLERVWRLPAASEEEALTQVMHGEADAWFVSEEQIDNTPYEVEEYET